MPASALINVHVDIMSAVALFRRIFEYLDLPCRDRRPGGSDAHRAAARRAALRARVDELSAGTLTVTDIDFEVRPGQMVALVGPSGAGKTTLTYLATRLYDPSEGRVTVRRRRPARADARRPVAVDRQGDAGDDALPRHGRGEPPLRASPTRPASELERACQRRAARRGHRRSCPQGYDTVVGERGFKLSGGENAAARDRARPAA